ncbi:hypothetical protein ACGFW5_22825 [Streptomyces sp. NPDC048416]|uniref:hypothetical protein n=1 Tax=Streptomyces sp. NPDC048416 TaxID=3365546 RepID=UPI0037159F72
MSRSAESWSAESRSSAAHPGTRRGVVVAVALLCTAVTACGTARPDDPAAVARPKASAGSTTGAGCGDRTTEETGPSGAGPATEDEAGTPGAPTDEGAAAGDPGPPTDGDTAAGDPGPPTDGTAQPCLPAGWFDMTRGFTDYYAQHLTKADDGMWPLVRAVRIRKQAGAEEAVVTVNFEPLGDGDWQGRRVAEVFGAWRLNEYGDKGTLRVETRSGGLIAEQSW